MSDRFDSAAVERRLDVLDRAQEEMDGFELDQVSDELAEPQFGTRRLITGVAGSGKSHTTRLEIERDPRYGILVGTTGIAAINMGEGVTTIHSALGFFNTASMIQGYNAGYIQRKLRKIKKRGFRNVIVDECFDYMQPVLTENGYKRIGQLATVNAKINVWSMNPQTYNLELKPVVRWIEHPAPEYLLEIDASRTDSKRGQRLIRCTPEHKILTPDGYVRAVDLHVGSQVIARAKSLSLTQKSLIVGSIFGDGSLTKNGNVRTSKQLRLTQGEDQLEYLLFKRGLFGDHAGSIQQSKSGYGDKAIYNLNVKVSDFMEELAVEMIPFKWHNRTYWNPTDKLISLLDEQALAIWFLDDGSLMQRLRKRDQSMMRIASIHTPPFSKETHDRLVAYLQSRFDLISKVIANGKGGYRLDFSVKETEKLLDIIRPYCPACMAYKVPGAKFSTLTNNSLDTSCAEVRSMKYIKRPRGHAKVYDMEVEDNHNYIAGNIIVSNCSMMPDRQLDILHAACAEVDMGIILLGDFCQLPPIPDDDERARAKAERRRARVPWAFDAECWSLFERDTVKLTKIWRQSDPTFLNALNAIRSGDGARGVELLRECPVEWRTSADPNFAGTTIVATNEEVARYNFTAQLANKSEPIKLNTRRRGKQLGEWKNIPEQQVFKVGDYVMILSNSRVDKHHVLYCSRCGKEKTHEQSLRALSTNISSADALAEHKEEGAKSEEILQSELRVPVGEEVLSEVERVDAQKTQREVRSLEGGKEESRGIHLPLSSRTPERELNGLLSRTSVSNGEEVRETSIQEGESASSQRNTKRQSPSKSGTNISRTASSGKDQLSVLQKGILDSLICDACGNRLSNLEKMGFNYVNGDCGHIVDFTGSEFIVKLVRNERDVTIPMLTRYSEQQDEPHAELWAKCQAQGFTPYFEPMKRKIRNDESGEWEEIDLGGAWRLGQIDYYPIRLASATSVHKTQALSLDKIQMDIRHPFYGAPAMCYVSMSRVRSPGGLTIVGSPQLLASKVNIDEKVRRWL